ncbi:MAG: head decoration protein [Oscillospiraceae bacterium]|nr:head decoration protein [Oscillospiraceae bacterium]
MNKNLVNKVGERGQDNLIARLYPRALTTGVNIVAGAGELARGTVLSRKDDGTCEVMAEGGTPAYILADPVDATGDAAVAAVVYRSGNFNPNAIIVSDGYALTAADKDTLRKYDIVFTDMMDD